MRILSADWVVPVEGPPIPDGAVAIEDGRIAAVGPVSELGEGERFPDAVVVPGFVNAHSHLEYAVYAGFGDGLPFAPWIATHVERKARIGIDEMEAIARFGAAESLRSAVTTVADASYSGAAAVAAAELGLRAIVYVEVFGSGTEHIVTRFETHRARIAPALSERVRLGISPHSVFSASLELWQAAAELGLPMATHFAESAAEVEWVRSRRGPFAEVLDGTVPPTSIAELAERGLLTNRLVAAHCVKVDDDEIGLLAQHDVAVAHCPRSNGLLGCGVAPVAELLAAGIRVGLGTDSPASAPSFDFFDELRAALLQARARSGDPAAMTAAAALELATLGGARALGLDAETGSLVAGKRADLAVLSFAGSGWLPWEDAVTAAVLGGSPERVLLTIVDGEPRYRKGESEWRELTAAAQVARARLLARAATTRR